eukprot:CAMPEP_0170283324 /NCGR_PEP_ID=MMETSP0116_2-20130129/41694_1 /TAXON_ID=400756 /ORGANISM="Durinskia baltica, Strain CSIRO CS-38" /LENGTH=235 /DNA_ID=CAMNT_0010534691 /DNA_START=112 /DNA_END=815 /DNA_ORIENTATION=-
MVSPSGGSWCAGLMAHRPAAAANLASAAAARLLAAAASGASAAMAPTPVSAPRPRRLAVQQGLPCDGPGARTPLVVPLLEDAADRREGLRAAPPVPAVVAVAPAPTPVAGSASAARVTATFGMLGRLAARAPSAAGTAVLDQGANADQHAVDVHAARLQLLVRLLGSAGGSEADVHVVLARDSRIWRLAAVDHLAELGHGAHEGHTVMLRLDALGNPHRHSAGHRVNGSCATREP